MTTVAEHVLDAMAMAHAVVADPQFRFPARPRVVPGLVRIDTPDGLLVEGGPTRQSFQGNAATGLLRRVMDAADGTGDRTELARRLEVPAARLWPVLSLLYTTGLLEDAESVVATTDSAPDPRLAFLARSIDTTRVNISGTQAAQRWQRARVQLVGDPAQDGFTRALAGALRRDGAGAVTITTDPSLAAPTGVGIILLIAVGDTPRVRAAALTARAAGVPVLPVRLEADRLHVGPLLDSVHTACARCALAGRSAVTGHVDEIDSHRTDFAAALVAREVFTMLSRVGTSPAERYLVSTDLDTLEQANRAITPDPSCVVCMDPPDPTAPAGDGIPLAWAYTHAVAFRPRSAVNPRDHQVHYNSGNIALQRRHRAWPASPLVPLRQADRATALPPGLHRDTVGHLLIRIAGLRHGPSGGPNRVDRWCATGGNLGSVSVYLVARDVAGLEPGIYGFSRAEPALARLTWADPHTPVAGVPDDAGAALVLTGALDIVATKYGPFAWRILQLDAGVALTQAHRVAAGLGLAVTPAVTWDDDRLAELLATAGDAEPITAVAAVAPLSHPLQPISGAR